jgi:hypothetical protein
MRSAICSTGRASRLAAPNALRVAWGVASRAGRRSPSTPCRTSQCPLPSRGQVGCGLRTPYGSQEFGDASGAAEAISVINRKAEARRIVSRIAISGGRKPSVASTLASSDVTGAVSLRPRYLPRPSAWACPRAPAPARWTVGTAMTSIMVSRSSPLAVDEPSDSDPLRTFVLAPCGVLHSRLVVAVQLRLPASVVIYLASYLPLSLVLLARISRFQGWAELSATHSNALAVGTASFRSGIRLRHSWLRSSHESHP